MPAKILVIDDEPDLELLINQKFKKQIRAQEYQFIFVQSAGEALLKLLNKVDIDIVLSDINMPGIDGLSLLAKITQINPLLKTVIVSAYSDISKIRYAMNNGAFDFLPKPIDFQDLELTINKTISYVVESKKNLALKQELEKTLRQQELVFENISDGIMIIDSSGQIMDCNPSAQRIFGYSKAEVLGRNLEFLYMPEDSITLTQQIMEKIKVGDRWIGKVNFIHKDGTQLRCQSQFLPLSSQNLEILAILEFNYNNHG